MYVGQPASVDGNSRVIAATACPTILARGICRSLTWRQACAQKEWALLAWCVMAVDPDPVMVMPTPMPWDPNPVSAADVIAGPMDIIRPVTTLDVHNDSIYHRCHCREHCQKYSNFPFHICNFIS